MQQLIEFTSKGLYCPIGRFYIDPWDSVEKAIITHAHSDHAKPGSAYYLSHPLTSALLRARLGDNNYHTVDWGDSFYINGLKVSLHPAGHIIGSSQVRLEYRNEVWVVSGDYKLENDGLSGTFEPLRCNVFITESTFGLPIYKWKPQSELFNDICDWVSLNKEQGRSSVFIAYSLGKAQRLLNALQPFNETVLVHGAIWNMHQALVGAGVTLPTVERITPETPKAKFKSCIAIAPPGADGSVWIRKFEPYELAICSGWMQVRGNVRRRNADAGFVLSDHADWEGLLNAVKETGAEKVFVTHGFQSVFSRYLNENGIPSSEVKTAYGSEDEDGNNILSLPEQHDADRQINNRNDIDS